jgi:hypothetical protein
MGNLWRELKTWIVRCDSCSSVKRKVGMEIDQPYGLPKNWETRTYEGGGHYGLPHRTKVLCPKCAKKEL